MWGGGGACVYFLGSGFWYAGSTFPGARRYLRLEPSLKALARERETLRQMTGPAVCFKPIGELVREINRHLRGVPQDQRVRSRAFDPAFAPAEPTALPSPGSNYLLSTPH